MKRICQICSRLAGSDVKVEIGTQEQKLSHVHFHFRHLRMVYGQNVTIQDLLDACFSEKTRQHKRTVDAIEDGKKTDEQGDAVGARLRNLSKSLCEKNGLNDKIFCSECHCRLHCKHTDGSLSHSVLINHACAHLDKPLFECCICNHTTATKGAIFRHAASLHGLKRTKGSFKDLTFSHVDEVMASMNKCFGQSDHQNGASNGIEGKRFKNKTGIVNKFRSIARGRPEHEERMVLCYQLIQRFAKPETGEIQCRRCSANIIVYRRCNGRVCGFAALSHVQSHLKVPIYTCRLCQVRLHSYLVLRVHLKQTHGLPVTGNYDDRSSDFKAEILGMMTDCFDWSKEMP